MEKWIDPHWLDLLLKTGAAILAISILYATIAYSFTKRTIFQTVPATATESTDVIAYYYLPAPLIKITAVAKVEIVTDTATNKINSATLKSLSISAVAETLPDTSQLLLVKYTGSSFANDDVKIGINAIGLLENVASVTEDRFTNIISALLEAPGAALQNAIPAALRQEDIPTVTTEVKEYTKEFIVTPDNIKVGGGDSFDWIIDIPDTANPQTQVNASFKVNFTSPFTGAGQSTPSGTLTITDGEGIYVRPTVILRISFLPGKANPLQAITANDATISVPDVSKAVLIPVTRAMMVKKTQGLKLQNGMLLENSIVKPSESEALVSIPVNILKAIFSIPAQLLSFRINHVQQRTKLVTEDTALAKAQLDSEKAKLGTEAELAKVKLDAQKTLASYEQDLLKAKLDTQKAVIDAEKAKITSETDLAKAKLDNEKAKQGHDAELAKAKLESEKELKEAQKNVFTEQTNLLKEWRSLMEEMKKKLP